MNGAKSVERLAFDPNWPTAYVRRRTSRRLSLKLDGDGTPWVTAPRSVSSRQIRAWLIDKRAWLTKQRERQQQAYGVLAGGQLGDAIVIEHEQGLNLTARLNHSALILTHPNDFKRWPELYKIARSQIKCSLTLAAEQNLPSRLYQIAETHDFHPAALRVRFMRTRWGSCSTNGSITLNSQLVRLDQVVSDYVIVHELAHLRQRHHQSSFWREVERVVPDYDLKRRRLRRVHLFD